MGLSTKNLNREFFEREDPLRRNSCYIIILWKSGTRMADFPLSALPALPPSAPSELVMGLATPAAPSGVVPVVVAAARKPAGVAVAAASPGTGHLGGGHLDNQRARARRNFRRWWGQARLKLRCGSSQLCKDWRNGRALKRLEERKKQMLKNAAKNNFLSSKKLGKKGGNLRKCPKVGGPCGHLSGPRAQKCKCGASFSSVTESSLLKRSLRKRKAKSVSYERASQKARLAYYEKHFKKTCPFCQEVVAFNNSKGIVYLCSECRVASCFECAMKFAQSQLECHMVDSMTGDQPVNFSFYDDEPLYFDAKRYGKWKCPGTCGKFKTFPVFADDGIGTPSLDASCYTDSNGDLQFESYNIKYLEWKAPDNASEWDLAHERSLKARSERAKILILQEEEIKMKWGWVVHWGMIPFIEGTTNVYSRDEWYAWVCPLQDQDFLTILTKVFCDGAVRFNGGTCPATYAPSPARHVVAVPVSANPVKKIELYLNRLTRENHYDMGMELEEREGGLEVTQVDPESPAEKSGFKMGMIIEDIKTPQRIIGMWNYEIMGCPTDVQVFKDKIKEAALKSREPADVNPLHKLIFRVQCPIVV